MDYSGWCIVSDYDGTLVTDPAQGITPETIEAIRRFTEGGGRLGIATGRGACEMSMLLDDRVIQGLPGLYYNGAMVMEQGKDRPLFCCPLPPDYRELVSKIIDRFPNIGIYVCDMDRLSFVQELEYTEKEKEEIYRTYSGKPATPEAMEKFEVNQQRPWVVNEPLERADDIAYKLLLVGTVEAIQGLIDWLRTVPGSDRYKAARPFDFNLEIVSSEAGKGTALSWLIEHWDLDRVIALGDGENDIEMFQAAPYSIAAYRAPDYVKAAATMTCGAGENIIDAALRLIRESGS